MYGFFCHKSVIFASIQLKIIEIKTIGVDLDFIDSDLIYRL